MNNKSSAFRIPFWIGMMGLMYGLAVGPVVRFGTVRSGAPQPYYHLTGFARTVWRPIMLLDDTRARPLFRAYMRVWGVKIYQVNCYGFA